MYYILAPHFRGGISHMTNIQGHRHAPHIFNLCTNRRRRLSRLREGLVCGARMFVGFGCASIRNNITFCGQRHYTRHTSLFHAFTRMLLLRCTFSIQLLGVLGAPTKCTNGLRIGSKRRLLRQPLSHTGSWCLSSWKRCACTRTCSFSD